jgi:lanthanide-dependent methanol dehydrogenase
MTISRRTSALLLPALGCLFAAALFAAAPAHANDQLIEMAKNPKDWVMPLGNYAGHRYSALDQINESNVGKLQVAWMFSTGVLRGHEGSPLVIGNTMYFVTPFPNEVTALNLADEKKVIWSYRPKQDEEAVVKRMCCDTVNRGLAYGDGMLFLQQADTTLVAIEAKTSREMWKVANGDPKRGETGTAAPLYVRNKVIVGVSGGEFGVRCHLTAYETLMEPQGKYPPAKARLVWRAYTAGPDNEILFDPEKTTSLGKPVGKDSSLASWSGEDWKIGGGCAHGWITYDPDLNLIYYGTGNPAPWNPKQRPGDNKWTASIIARDADTGVARWVYQTTPHDEWDYDATAESILVDLPVGGVARKALVQFNKNGIAYALDRATGELISANKFELKTNWATGVDLDANSKAYGRPSINLTYSPDANGQDVNTRGICPFSTGAKGASPASWQPTAKLFVVPTSHMCMDYEPFAVRFAAGQPYVGSTLSLYPAPDSHGGQGNLVAWDPSQRKIIWSKPEQFSLQSGPLSTAGGLIFYGTLEGNFKAVRLKDGKEVFKFKIGSGMLGNAFSYEFAGKQFIGIFSGIGGMAGIGIAAGLTDPRDGLSFSSGGASVRQYTRLGGNLVVFALPDDVAFPKAPKP